MRAENASVAGEALHDNWQRMPVILPTLLGLILTSMVAVWYSLEWVPTIDHRWVKAYGWVDLIMFVCSLLAWLYIGPTASRRRPAPEGPLPVLLFAAGLLLYAVAMTVVEQWGRSTVAIYGLGCVFAGVLFLLRPGHAAALYIASYAVFYRGLAWTNVNETTLLDNRVQGVFSAALGLMLSFLLWRKHKTMVLLRREVEHQRIVLVATNEELERRRQELEFVAHTDSLTKLANRREFFRVAEIELHRRRRYGGNTSLIMLDVDFFKHVNDTFGHPGGDRVLVFLADVLRKSVRHTDVVARVGGEEFAILLPETPLEGALLLAEKLRATVQKSSIEAEGVPTINITVSLGVTTATEDRNGSTESLYAAADHALYAAKGLGRNRVEAGQEIPPGTAAAAT